MRMSNLLPNSPACTICRSLPAAPTSASTPTANKLSLEHAARELRYQWLLELARDQRFDAIATGHTADDQAETVLMKFLRGAGTRGLGRHSSGTHAREHPHRSPACWKPRATEVENYLATLNQPWREDHTNLDTQLHPQSHPA